jgi:hypothetical protein
MTAAAGLVVLRSSAGCQVFRPCQTHAHECHFPSSCRPRFRPGAWPAGDLPGAGADRAHPAGAQGPPSGCSRPSQPMARGWREKRSIACPAAGTSPVFSFLPPPTSPCAVTTRPTMTSPGWMGSISAGPAARTRPTRLGALGMMAAPAMAVPPSRSSCRPRSGSASSCLPVVSWS